MADDWDESGDTVSWIETAGSAVWIKPKELF